MKLQQIADLLEFNIEDVEILMDIFLNDANASLEQVQSSIESNDFEQIKNTAHGIKGSALNLMLEEIARIALQIEQLAKTESSADYHTLFKKLKLELSSIEEIKVVV